MRNIVPNLVYVLVRDGEVLIAAQYTKTSFYGWPRTAYLHRQGYEINHKRVQRLIQKMGLQAIYPKRLF